MSSLSALFRLAAGIAVVCAACACSSQQFYAMGRQAQRNECMKQPDPTARDRCLKDAGLSYDDYQRESAGGRAGAR